MLVHNVRIYNNITERWRDYFAQLGLYNSVDDDGFETVFYDRLAIYDQSTVSYIVTVHDMLECMVKQTSGKAVSLDGVAMKAILIQARSWLYTYAYCLSTLLNYIFTIVFTRT